MRSQRLGRRNIAHGAEHQARLLPQSVPARRHGRRVLPLLLLWATPDYEVSLQTLTVSPFSIPPARVPTRLWLRGRSGAHSCTHFNLSRRQPFGEDYTRRSPSFYESRPLCLSFIPRFLVRNRCRVRYQPLSSHISSTPQQIIRPPNDSPQ